MGSTLYIITLLLVTIGTLAKSHVIRYSQSSNAAIGFTPFGRGTRVIILLVHATSQSSSSTSSMGTSTKRVLL